MGALDLLFIVSIVFPALASAQTTGSCPRPTPGSVVTQPPDLYSKYGVLNVSFDYYTTVDTVGRTLFCFVTPAGQNRRPCMSTRATRLNLSVTNLNPVPPPGSPTEIVSNASDACGDATMTITSLNVHFHGTNTSPRCHGDEVIHTLIILGHEDAGMMAIIRVLPKS